jgi:hypothetical protein
MTQEFSTAGFFVNHVPSGPEYTMGAIFQIFYENSFPLLSLVELFDEGNPILQLPFKALMDASLYFFFVKKCKGDNETIEQFSPPISSHNLTHYIGSK